ncbi:cytochrome c peroxidase [Dyadobacter sp. 676]|uniref:Cytochrome c peroxidase n=1 Tax=Dyadobacter sp. 676 TaxID=3088362 RepID=A0AAU8FLA2_9BACT
MLKFARNPNSFVYRHRRLLFSLFLIIVIPLIVCLIWWLTRPESTPVRRIKQTFLQDIITLDSAVSRLQTDIRAKRPAAIQESFKRARLAYKRLEFISAYYSPETTRALNGPNIPEVDDDLRVNEPQGFQVLEEMVFPEVATDAYPGMLHTANVIRSNVNRLRKISETNELTDSHIFDAMRLEVFRIVSMGITGFDSPVAFHSLPEVASALSGMRDQLARYPSGDGNNAKMAELDSAFDAAIAYIRKSSDFNAFDRLEFIKYYANPLSSGLLDAQKALGIPVFTEKRLLSASARTLTDSGAFDAGYFVNFEEQAMTAERIALGKMLFFSPVLSNNSGRTCATCHQPGKAFTDGEPRSFALGFNGMRVSRNAPTLLNASFQAAQFADSRVTFLEDQASDVIRNPEEMHGSLPDAVAALSRQPGSRKLFEEAYPDGVNESNLKNAIASYIRSLSSLDSRLDRHFRRSENLLTAQEKSGFNLFMGKAKCATCHFFPLFNGTVPPAYLETESEVLGTPATAEGKAVDPDLGKFMLTKREPHRYAFKTPTVRHVALTAPYMHNGVFRTLEEVVDFYDRGGGNGLGFNLENQTLPFDKLNLSDSEKKALIAFMKIL